VTQWAFSHQPLVHSVNCCCLGRMSQQMLCSANPSMLIWCSCVKCWSTVSLRSLSFCVISLPTFWKHMQMWSLCFFLIDNPTSLNDLDLRLPHPRLEQDMLQWVVPLAVHNMQRGGPHCFLHHTALSCWSARSTCVASGMALGIGLRLGGSK